MRPEGAGLNAREAGGLVDLEHAVEPPEVHGDRAPALAHRCLEAPGDARSATEGNQHRVVVEGGSQYRRHVGLAARPKHDVRQPAEVAGALTHEVAQALAARV